MINTVVLTGNLTRDPEVRVTTTGKSVVTLGLAVNNPFNKEKTLFINVQAWEKQSEFAAKNLKKGSAIEVVGRLEQDNWEDKDGNKRSSIFVVANSLSYYGFAAKKEESGTRTESAPQTAAVQEDIDDSVPF